jgi:sucrose phosphorylase
MDRNQSINFYQLERIWEGNGVKNEDGIIIPKAEYLSKLFMRKSGYRC